MHRLYTAGRHAALDHLSVKTAMRSIPIKGGADPLTDVSRRLSQVFQTKMPKLDVDAQIQRMLGNPFKQPQNAMAGNISALKV